MRTHVFIIGMLLCIHPLNIQAESLASAMARAASQHPRLQMAEQSVEVAKEQLHEQGAYAYNPELSLESQRRRLNGGGTSNDYYITLSQGIEIAGKRGLREQAAKAALDAISARRDATQQQLRIEAARAYVDLFFARRIYDLRRQQSEMLRSVSDAVARQLELGQSSQLQANLAQSAFAAAFNAATAAERRLNRSRQAYSLVLGAAGENEASLTLPALLPDWRPAGDAYALALKSRPEFAALQAQLVQSDARAELAGAERIPDITLSAMTGREAGDRLIKLGVTIPVPLLNSHQGAYRAAVVEKERVSTGMAWSKQQLRYEVQNALDNHRDAMQALSDLMNSRMPQRARDTVALARRAYDAGELDLEALVIHSKQGLEAQITALDIMQQAWLARIRLAEVLGHPEYILQGTKP